MGLLLILPYFLFLICIVRELHKQTSFLLNSHVTPLCNNTIKNNSRVSLEEKRSGFFYYLGHTIWINEKIDFNNML